MATHSSLDDLNQRFSNIALSNDDATGEPSTASRRRTPVDQYFYQHASRPGSKFKYNSDTKLNIRKTFDDLAKAEKWRRKKRLAEKRKFFQAIDSEFTTRFGDGNKLETWQRLVAMFEPDSPPPMSITKCKKVLSEYYINIYDFLEYCQEMGIDEQAGIQGDLKSLDKGSLQNLRTYSKSGNLLYPLDFAKGRVLQAFLVHMFG
ncbi:hypothetical protein TWF569_000014 [Orbilia oligospora]|uniref:Uncharacterized protein n=1 Tax=Orbilia oligospora TaxID=2813651 RepID=A0A7C8JB76_ORBOL|nr:hypothetical protein TWF103_002636 [Orbilia oligospora]KAF3084132.1 hypothetical protein TWF706_000837 [Orbilia oligospora]KAF3102035.1 hypothetical protein TWF102_004761 [Orbilia oligospora]KAF3122742.1 hypothetical protein TWF703_001134 [Orbilia oligospora]KAF3157432.1 hypothetical protein TWF569_000014 [Orbilia oligospora]